MIYLLEGYEIEKYESALATLSIAYTKDEDRIKTCDGLLVPGGHDVTPALYHEEENGARNYDLKRDEKALRVIDYFVRNQKKIMGICRGHQLLNVYFGGTLIQDLSTSIRHRREDHTEAFHEVCNEGYLKDLYGERMMVNSTHHQAVKDLGTGFEVIARSIDGVVEAMVHKSLPIITTQFHPEMMKTAKGVADGDKILRYFAEMR